MTFEEILPHLRSGKHVRRTSWHAPWSTLQQNIWFETTTTGTPVLLSLFETRIHLSARDLNATDWELYSK